MWQGFSWTTKASNVTLVYTRLCMTRTRSLSSPLLWCWGEWKLSIPRRAWREVGVPMDPRPPKHHSTGLDGLHAGVQRAQYTRDSCARPSSRSCCTASHSRPRASTWAPTLRAATRRTPMIAHRQGKPAIFTAKIFMTEFAWQRPSQPTYVMIAGELTVKDFDRLVVSAALHYHINDLTHHSKFLNFANLRSRCNN